MKDIKLPTFYRPEVLDQMILAGMMPVLSVQCLVCGAMGDYDNWTVGVSKNGSLKLCPSCGHYAGGRI